jgi:hypothetical protein
MNRGGLSFMEEKCERYCSIEESLIEACKEVNLMRKGLLPERTLDELWAELEKDLPEENSLKQPKRKVVAMA